MYLVFNDEFDKMHKPPTVILNSHTPSTPLSGLVALQSIRFTPACRSSFGDLLHCGVRVWFVRGFSKRGISQLTSFTVSNFKLSGQERILGGSLSAK